MGTSKELSAETKCTFRFELSALSLELSNHFPALRGGFEM
jgi:hypothetical protein